LNFAKMFNMIGFVGVFFWPLPGPGFGANRNAEAGPPGYESPVMAFEMGKYFADFAVAGHRFFNGEVLPVAVTTP
jgi:hypothetical protein